MLKPGQPQARQGAALWSQGECGRGREILQGREEEKGGRPEPLVGTGVQRGHGWSLGGVQAWVSAKIPMPELVTGPAGPAVLKRCQQRGL